jgi:hypothetical protein
MENEAKSNRRIFEHEGPNWVRMAAGGSLLAGGLMLLTSNRKAGMVTAAAGTALALLDQQETVKLWWDALPGYIDKVQDLLGRVEATVSELDGQRARLEKILSR